MSLTERRKQFLEQIVHLYEETQLPVHYSTIAEAIGVSKWTAYDVLKELENHGYLTRDYAVNSNETGRSVVVFIPTEKSEQLFKHSRAAITTSAELLHQKRKVTSLLQELQAYPLKQAVDRLLQEISLVEYRVEFCAYFLGILLIFLNSLGKTVRDLSINVIHTSAKPVLQLTMFVGTVVGMMIQSVGEELSPQMAELVGRFLGYMEELEQQELDTLTEILQEYPKTQ